MKINQLRMMLADWGRYWERMETPKGYPGTSITLSLAQSAKTGIWSTSKDKGQLSLSDNINPPGWVNELDQIISSLPVDQRKLIHLRYIKNKPVKTLCKIELMKAELQVLAKF